MGVLFIVYAYFESFITQLPTCQPNPAKSYTKQYQKHIPSGFCYNIKCFDDTLYSQQPCIFEKQFNDDDVGQISIDTLEKNIKEIYKKFKFPINMIILLLAFACLVKPYDGCFVSTVEWSQSAL